METYLSNENVEQIYSLVKTKIEDQTNQNLDHHPKFKTKMVTLMDKIYQTSPNDDLLVLNKKAVASIVPFFRKLVQKKTRNQSQNQSQNQSNNPYSYGTSQGIVSNYGPNQAINPNPVSSQGNYDPDLGMTLMQRQDKHELDQRLQQFQNGRQALDQQLNPTQNMNDIPQFGESVELDNSQIKNKYEMLSQSRNQEIHTNLPPPSPQQLENFQSQIQVKSVPQNIQPTGFQISSFDIDSNMAQDLGHPLSFQSDTNIMTDDGPDLKSLHEKLQNDRQRNTDDYQLYQKQQQEMLQSSDESKDEYLRRNLNPQLTDFSDTSSYLERRNRAGINTGDTHLNSSIAKELYKPVEIKQITQQVREEENKLLRQVDSNDYFVNDIPTNNPRFDKYLSGLRQGNDQYGKRNYMETDHYVTINSADRQWENDGENRYNFVVHFNASDGTSGAAVTRNFRNIVSIELLKLIIPQDHHPMPFDHRLYMDFMSFPYLSLHIDEIDGVFYGTTNSTTKAFDHLIFDKEYATDILTSEQITSDTIHTTSGIKHKFSKQYKRGFYALCPIYDEKKIYYHTPKASLNRMTIRLLTSEGIVLNPLKDHLKISAIVFETPGDEELKATNGFPRRGGQEIIKITTTTYFSNRTFRIGDKIKIKNYTVTSTGTNDTRFQEFINRDNGHYIINLDEEVTGGSENEGYINNIYIAPPGNIDFNLGRLDLTSYYTASPTVSNYGDLLNTSLQMHLMFRITVREDESRGIFHPHNI